MEKETPRFNSGENKEKRLDDLESFAKLLMECYEKRAAKTPDLKPKKLDSPKKPNKKFSDFTRIKKQKRNYVSQDKDKYASLLLKRFILRNDFDEEHVDEFLLSKEQAFEFPL